MKPGFWSGVAAIGRACWFLLRTPRAWPAALLPGVVLVCLSALVVWASLAVLRPVVEEPAAGLGPLVRTLLPWFAAAAATVLGWLVALAATPPICAPALEHIVALRERDLGLEAHPAIGFFAEVWCGVRALVFGAALAIPVLAVATLVDLFIPLAWVVTIPIRWVVLSLSVAWNLFDYPLTLRGVPIRERWMLVRSHLRPVMGFGLSFAALFSLPCLSVLLLPVGVAAAAELVGRIRQTLPNLRGSALAQGPTSSIP
jgi:CysZ protein